MADPRAAAITVRQLLNQMSGLSDRTVDIGATQTRRPSRRIRRGAGDRAVSRRRPAPTGNTATSTTTSPPAWSKSSTAALPRVHASASV